MHPSVFLSASGSLFLIALSIFIVLRIIMKTKAKLHAAELAAAEEAKAKADAEAKAKAEAEAAAKAEADAQDLEKLQLLREIRDSLRK